LIGFSAIDLQVRPEAESATLSAIGVLLMSVVSWRQLGPYRVAVMQTDPMRPQGNRLISPVAFFARISSPETCYRTGSN
jgi:hypothetical protein